MQSLVSRWLKYRYLLLCAALFTLMIISISKQYWVGDFWEHSAVVNEFAYNPTNPQHSLLSSDAPHASGTHPARTATRNAPMETRR